MGGTRNAVRRYWLGGRRRPEQDQFFIAALDPAIWAPGDATDWDTCWYTGMPEATAFRRTGPGRTMNHIPGNNCLTVKSFLYKSLTRTRERLIAQEGPAHEYVARMDFAPRVYAMPEDYFALQQAAHEAPDRRWILKPRNAARGKDIRLLADVATVPAGRRWMVQEYIDNPHTMNGHKYVLRLYVLIAGVEPLRVYLYEQGFAKLASAPYTLDDLENRYAHLTNPDINALNTDAPAPVVFVDLDRYRAWLRDQGHDDKALFASIRDMVSLTAISAREHMRQRTRESGADQAGCYELLGLDCLVDAQLKPWILECNLSPSMEVCAAPADGGVVEAQVKRQMIADMVSLLGLNTPSGEAGPSDPAERIVVEAEREQARAGGFRRVFPDAAAGDQLAFLPLPRLADIVLADAVRGTAVPRPRLRRWRATEIITEDRLTLYEAASGRCYRANPTAALTWLHATGGLDPDAIADALRAATLEAGAATDTWTIRRDVWDSLADWAHGGLLLREGVAVPHGAGTATTPVVDARRATARHAGEHCFELQAGASMVRIRSAELPVMHRLRELFSPMAVTARVTAAERQDICIVRAAPGYGVIINGVLEPCTPRLAELAPWLVSLLLQRAAGVAQLALDGCVVSLGQGGSATLVCCNAESDDGVALALAARCGQGFGGGLLLAAGAAAPASVIGLPARSRAAASCPIDTRAADARSRIYQAPGIGELRLLPAALAGGPCDIGAVILVERAASPGRAVTAIAVDEFLPRLLPHCFAIGGTRPEAEAVQSLGLWLSQRKLLVADPSATAAVDKLSSLV